MKRDRPKKGERIRLRDGRGPNLPIVVGERSASWISNPRLKNGKRASIALGRWPAMDIPDARRAAQDVRRVVDAGGDPNAEKREAVRQAEQTAKSRHRLSDVVDEYEREKLASLRRGTAVRRALDGKKGLLREFIRREPVSIIKADIADAVKKPGEENQRDRYHSIDELAEIWKAAGTRGCLMCDVRANAGRPTSRRSAASVSAIRRSPPANGLSSRAARMR